MISNIFNFTMLNADKSLYEMYSSYMMQTDIKEKEDSFEVVVDLPGFRKDEVKVELKNGYLTISAVKRHENKDEKDKNHKEKFIRKERYEGSMSRSFYVSGNVMQDDIHARYKDGILTLDILKKRPEEEKKCYVTIEG